MSRIVPMRVVRQVQARSLSMCEYCKLPGSLAFADFVVDHIIARAHGGGSELDNLAWSCLLCNLNKGPNIASVDPDTGRVTALFHPRWNDWRNHFRLAEGLILPRTARGRATVALLKPNMPQTFGLRRAFEHVDPRYAGRVVQRCR